MEEEEEEEMRCVMRGLVYHPEACVKMVNTQFGEKKLSDLTVVELKMEEEKRGLSKKALRVSLQNSLNLLVIMNILLCVRKEKFVTLLPLFLLLLLMFLMIMMLRETVAIVMYAARIF